MTWAPAYATLAELKSSLRIPDTADDNELTFAIEAASRTIDHLTNRQFGVVAAAEARHYTARWDKHRRRYIVDIDDLMSTTNLAVAADDDDDGTYTDVTWTLNTDYTLEPVNSPDVSRPWTQIVFRASADSPPCTRYAIQVTAVFGWSSIPDAITQATMTQATRYLYRREAPFGVAGSPTVGSELRLLAQVDPDVMVMTRPFRRVWGAV